MDFDPRTNTTDSQRREAAYELLGKLNILGISQLLRDVTANLDTGRTDLPVSYRLLLGCWNGINSGIESFAKQQRLDISTPDARQTLVERLTETYTRALIEYELGYRINGIEGDINQ